MWEKEPWSAWLDSCPKGRVMSRSKAIASLLVLSIAGTLGAIGCATSDDPAPEAELMPSTTKKKEDAGSSKSNKPTTPDEVGDGDPETNPDAGPGSTETPDATPPVSMITAVKLDGKEMTVTASESHVNQYGAFLKLDFNGTGAPANTNVLVNFQKTGKGCQGGAKAQHLYYYPANSSSNAYRSTEDADCGLEITSYPTNVGDIASGTFNGKILGTNGETGKTKQLEFTFYVKSIPQP
jgi:hypothetical protein